MVSVSKAVQRRRESIIEGLKSFYFPEAGNVYLVGKCVRFLLHCCSQGSHEIPHVEPISWASQLMSASFEVAWNGYGNGAADARGTPFLPQMLQKQVAAQAEAYRMNYLTPIRYGIQDGTKVLCCS